MIAIAREAVVFASPNVTPSREVV
jgi:hypothetical protein